MADEAMRQRATIHRALQRAAAAEALAAAKATARAIESSITVRAQRRPRAEAAPPPRCDKAAKR